MGLRGQIPQPTAVKLLNGNPGRRPINQAEPKPRSGAPVCPAQVRADPAALKEWRRLLPILKRMKVLTEADGIVLANLCTVHSLLLLQLAKIRELNAGSKTGIAGLVIATKSGYLALNQIYANVQTCMEQELKLCRELGLTPSARTRINADAEKKETSAPGSTLDGNWGPARVA